MRNLATCREIFISSLVENERHNRADIIQELEWPADGATSAGYARDRLSGKDTCKSITVLSPSYVQAGIYTANSSGRPLLLR